MILDTSQIIKNIGWNIDPSGFVFKYENKLLRAISNDRKEDFLFLFNNGVIEELNSKKLIPFTSISTYSLAGFDLVLEHQKISPITYSTEWSFEMIKEASLTIVEVNKILFRYGFETKDAHNHNILFDGCIAKFVDIGSFQKRKNKKYWECKDEFNRIFVYPLKMWSRGNVQLARKSISDVAGYINNLEYKLYRYPILRFLPNKALSKLFYYSEVLRNLSKFDLDNIFIVKNSESKRRLLKFLNRLSIIGILPNNSINLNKLQKKIEKIRKPKSSTKWGSYQAEVDKDELFNSGGRFDIIIDLLKKLNVTEALEIGGNQGLLSIILKGFVDKVICTDYDEVAVDTMFLNAKKQNVKISTALLDVLHPIYLSTDFSEKLIPQIRFNSQAVLVLAVTHHLILGQKVPIDVMFETLIPYCKEYLFIEFMPNGISKEPVPDWYKISWFRNHFEKYFESILETPSVKDGNRILFVGKLKELNIQ